MDHVKKDHASYVVETTTLVFSERNRVMITAEELAVYIPHGDVIERRARCKVRESFLCHLSEEARKAIEENGGASPEVAAQLAVAEAIERQRLTSAVLRPSDPTLE